MFSFFKKKEPSVKIIDKIWLNEHAKFKACLNMYQKNSQLIFITWFTETFEKLNTFLEQQGIKNAVVMYRNIYSTNNANLVFVEHYPLIEKEQELFSKLNLPTIIILTALDEPLMQVFGGERIVELMKKLGINEDEMIEHNMISSSIIKAQKKLAENITIENSANSQHDWFAKNYHK